jgi:hypothetical protein
MSDGPYRTLDMSKVWKALAKIAENAAHTVAEVAEAFRPALVEEWNAIRPDFAESVKAALGDDDRGRLFSEIAVAETERLRSQAANPMEALLADHARDQARDAHLGGAAYEKSIEHFLEDRAIRGARQMEEHYHRERSPDAGRLRNHLAAAITSGELAQLASGLASGAGRRALTAKADRSGLDEGVAL